MKWIDEYFFGNGSALRLGVCRALFYAFYLWQCYVYNPFAYLDFPPEFWRPIKILSAFPVPAESLMNGVVLAFALSCFFAAIGFRARTAGTIAALTGCYLFGAINSFNLVQIHFPPMQMIAFILPFAPIGDRFSVDSWIRNRGVRDDWVGGRYQWSVRFSQVILITLMFCAGIHKVTGNWLSQPAHNMEYFLRYKFFVHGKIKGEPLPDFVLLMTSHGWLMFVLGVFLVLIEFTCPLALVRRWKWVRFFSVVSLFLMQLFLAVAMNTLASFPWLCAYFFFVPWDRLWLRMNPRGIQVFTGE
ncbi:MAG: hypothetical protein AAGC68_00360 [Verrucomicrobiota bacterium]